MSDRQLFKYLAQQFAFGVGLGALFTAALLALNPHRLLDVVLDGAAPATILVILLVGVCAHFGFGMAITGFYFAIMDDESADRI
jgi:pimeloyl-ACP methyl ester carboxylesterase